MRVLVVGASGLLGRALVKAFAGAGHEVQGTALERAQKGNHLVLDVFKNEQVGVPHDRPAENSVTKFAQPARQATLSERA